MRNADKVRTSKYACTGHGGQQRPGPKESGTSPCPGLTVLNWFNSRNRGAERALAYLCSNLVAGGMGLASCYKEELQL